MELLQDNGTEHMHPVNSDSQSVQPNDTVIGLPKLEKTFVEDNDAYDDNEEADDQSDSPAVYLRKMWRKVSAEPLTFSCFRSPESRAYACTLKLPFPQASPRIFRSPPVYSSKRAAVHALSEYAIQCGILGEASRSMALLDNVSDPSTLPGPSRGPFDDSCNPRLAAPTDITFHQSAVTLLNLAVQKYCVEAPNVVLNFSHENTQRNGEQTNPPRPVYRCQLQVRISPEVHEVYSTTRSYNSIRSAKEAVAQLALQEGVVILFKLHNSMTTKICKQLGLPIPATLEDHDTFEEENTAGMITQLVQQVTRNTGAISTIFSEVHSETGDLSGAKLIVNLAVNDVRTYEMPALFRNKKEAKECVCRLAVKSGLRKDLESRMNLVQASRRAIDGFGRESSFIVNLSEAHGQDAENAISRLNTWAQTNMGGSDCLSYVFSEGNSPSPRFGCDLTVRLADGAIRKFQSEAVFPTKRLAKEAAAELAEKGLIPSEILPHTHANLATVPPSPLSPIFRDPAESSRQSISYETARNMRVETLDAPRERAEHAYTAPPPPYLADTRASTAAKRLGDLLENAKQYDLSTTSSGGQQYKEYQPSCSSDEADQPNLKSLRQHLLDAFGQDGLLRMSFHLHKEKRSARYSGTLRIEIDESDVHIFQSENASASIPAAKDDLSAKALAGDLWTRLSRASQQQHAPTSPPFDAKSGNRARSYHPVSYVHQMCQILIGIEPRHRPNFEVFRPSDSSLFAARLTVPVVPPKTYVCSPSHTSKAAAREAVAALSIAEGLVEHLKQCNGTAQLNNIIDSNVPENPAASTSNTTGPNVVLGHPVLDPVKVEPPQVRRPYTQQLHSYCLATARPEPIYQQTTPAISTGPSTPVSVIIGQQEFELEARQSEDQRSDTRERLARKVLKHFLAQDADAARDTSL